MENQEEKAESLPGCLLRIFWMILGNLALFFCAYFIASKPSTGKVQLSVFDAIYAAAALALILARYIDVRSCGGTTASGKPATMANFRRYAVILVIASAAVWAGAHAISYAR